MFLAPEPNFSNSNEPRLNDLSKAATKIGYEIVEIAGFLDAIDQKTSEQLGFLSELRGGADKVMHANSSVQTMVESVEAETNKSHVVIKGSLDHIRHAGHRSKAVASWVTGLDSRMTAIESSLADVTATNNEIVAIAKQVNILAINARIEAARAGEAGLGFAVVAEAINELSQKTSRATVGISESIETLSGWICTLKDESRNISNEAETVITDAADTDKDLADVERSMRATHSDICSIGSEARLVQSAGREFVPGFFNIGKVAEETAVEIRKVRQKANCLIDQSEKIVQETVAMGGSSDDAPFITFVARAARAASRSFMDGIEKGEIGLEDFFDHTYSPIPNTNPQQFIAPFTQFTDIALPEIQEAAFKVHSRVVFCAAVDRNGYLPTHNKVVSLPQGKDPVWNMSHCRNRRIFDDRVGLKAGRSKAPFLLQVYRREMGANNFKMMKDVSAPIFINGRHWGAMRLAYCVETTGDPT